MNSYNVRDQLVEVKEHKGPADANGVCGTGCQLTELKYDGHGRLKERWLPIYKGTSLDPNSTPYATYTYNVDDTLNQVVDSKGGLASFGYNARHLVTSVNYTPPASVAETLNLSFTYDELGNRTQMQEKDASLCTRRQTDYGYNTLGQMNQETRQFKVGGTCAPEISGTYKLTYAYNLAGQLKQLGYESSAYASENHTVTYDYDKAGQLKSVKGNGFGTSNDTEFTSLMTPIKYRAWGAAKQVTYGSGYVANLLYDSRLRASSYELSKQIGSTTDYAMQATYGYYPDGSLNTVNYLNDHRLDRTFGYDQKGRVNYTKAGGTGADIATHFEHSFGYDEMDRMTSRNAKYWYWSNPQYVNTTYTNDRASAVTTSQGTPNPTWRYDRAGNLTNDGTQQYVYDLLDRLVGDGTTTTNTYDGDGQLVKTSGTAGQTYYIRSSVLGGQIVEQLTATGQRDRTYIHALGHVLAEYEIAQFAGDQPKVCWRHRDPANVSERVISTTLGKHTLFINDPNGTKVQPVTPQEIQAYFQNQFSPEQIRNVPSYAYGNPSNLANGCTIDGARANCEKALQYLASGLAGYAVINFAGGLGADLGMDGLYSSLASRATSLNGKSINAAKTERKTPVPRRSDRDGADGEPEIVRGTGQERVRSRVDFGFLGFQLGGRRQQGGGQRGGGQQGGGQQGGTPPSNNPSCADFVNQMLDYFNQSRTRVGAGIGMMQLAVQGDGGTNFNGVPFTKHMPGEPDTETLNGARANPNGFRNDLVDNNQRGNVYHHIMFMAGSYLALPLGAVTAAGLVISDMGQAYIKRRSESETELRDDLAGAKVGVLLKNPLISRNRLRNSIREILCAP